MIQTVAIYARVSTTKPEQAASLEDQQRSLPALAERKRWAVSATYVDEGRSARSITKRPQFQAMLEAASRHEFDALLVTARDRWARSLEDSIAAQKHLNDLGIQVVDVAMVDLLDVIDQHSSGAWMQRTQQDVAAEYFSRVQGEKVSRGIASKVGLGLHWGDVPFGYRRPDAREPMVIDEGEAAVVQTLFERYATGTHSLAALAQWVNETTDYRTRNKGRTGARPFSNSSVRVIIDNPVYAGDLVVKGSVVGEGRHPAIVSRELFAQAKTVRGRGPRPRRVSNDRVYLVGGIARHSECRAPLWASSHAPSRSIQDGLVYRCSARQRGQDASCERVTGSVELVDAEISALFERIVLPDDWREEARAEYERLEAEQPQRDIARERRNIEGRLKRARQAIFDVLVPYEEAAAQIRDLEAQAAALQDLPQAKAVIAAGDRLLSLHELWPFMTPQEKSEAVHIVLEWVEVDLRGPVITVLSPHECFRPLFEAMAATEGGPVKKFCGCGPEGSGVFRQHLFVPAWKAA